MTHPTRTFISHVNLMTLVKHSLFLNLKTWIQNTNQKGTAIDTYLRKLKRRFYTLQVVILSIICKYGSKKDCCCCCLFRKRTFGAYSRLSLLRNWRSYSVLLCLWRWRTVKPQNLRAPKAKVFYLDPVYVSKCLG